LLPPPPPPPYFFFPPFLFFFLSRFFFFSQVWGLLPMCFWVNLGVGARFFPNFSFLFFFFSGGFFLRGFFWTTLFRPFRSGGMFRNRGWAPGSFYFFGLGGHTVGLGCWFLGVVLGGVGIVGRLSPPLDGFFFINLFSFEWSWFLCGGLVGCFSLWFHFFLFFPFQGVPCPSRWGFFISFSPVGALGYVNFHPFQGLWGTRVTLPPFRGGGSVSAFVGNSLVKKNFFPPLRPKPTWVKKGGPCKPPCFFLFWNRYFSFFFSFLFWW